MFLLIWIVATTTMFVLWMRYAKEQKETARNLYLAIIGANVILLVSIIADINSNDFGFVSCMKFGCLLPSVTYSLCLPIFTRIHANQAKRIFAVFNSELGDKVRTYLPTNAIVYGSLTHAITYQEENGNFKILSYSFLGFNDLPNNYEYVVCQWLRDNIVYNGEDYHFESMTYVNDRYEESDTATIKKTYTGNYEVTRDPGRYVTTNTTIGHALVRNGYNFEGYKVCTKPLKKW